MRQRCRLACEGSSLSASASSPWRVDAVARLLRPAPASRVARRAGRAPSAPRSARRRAASGVTALVFDAGAVGVDVHEGGHVIEAAAVLQQDLVRGRGSRSSRRGFGCTCGSLTTTPSIRPLRSCSAASSAAPPPFDTPAATTRTLSGVQRRPVEVGRSPPTARTRSTAGRTCPSPSRDSAGNARA